MAFCKKCGEELKSGAKFCGNCGAATQSTVATENSNNGCQAEDKPSGELLLRVKPKFVPMAKIAPVILQLVLFLGFAGAFFAMANAGSKGIPDMVYYFFGFFVFLWVGVPLIQLYFQKRTYEETEYKIYDDRVEYAEGFFAVQNNKMRLNRVVDVRYKQSMPQKWFNQGTITLRVAGASKIVFKDIPDPKDVYEQIDELLARYN